MAAKRHAVASKEDDRGRDDLLRFDARGDATDRAEKQVEQQRLVSRKDFINMPHRGKVR